MQRLLVFEDGSVAGCDASQWWVLSPDGKEPLPQLVEFRNSFAARPATSAGPPSHGLRGPEVARWTSGIGAKVALWSSAWFAADRLGRLGMLAYDVDNRRVKTFRPMEAWAADPDFGPVLRGDATAPLPTPHPREPWSPKDDFARILDGGYPKPCVVEWRAGAGIAFARGRSVEARPCDLDGLLYCARALVADGVCRSLVARIDGTVASKLSTLEDVRKWPQWRDVPSAFYDLVETFAAQRLSPHGAWWHWWWPHVASNRRVAKCIPGATLTYDTGHTRARFDDGLVLVVDQADKAIALVPGRPDVRFRVDVPPAHLAARITLLLHFRRWAEPEDRLKFQLQRDQARQRVQTAVQASKRFVKTLDATLLRGAPSVLDARSRQADRLLYKTRHKCPTPV